MGRPVERRAKLLRVERLTVLADRVDLEVVPPRLVLDDVAARAALVRTPKRTKPTLSKGDHSKREAQTASRARHTSSARHRTKP